MVKDHVFEVSRFFGKTSAELEQHQHQHNTNTNTNTNTNMPFCLATTTARSCIVLLPPFFLPETEKMPAVFDLVRARCFQSSQSKRAPLSRSCACACLLPPCLLASPTSPAQAAHLQSPQVWRASHVRPFTTTRRAQWMLAPQGRSAGRQPHAPYPAASGSPNWSSSFPSNKSSPPRQQHEDEESTW